METLQGILLLLTFVGLVVYCFKGGNLLFGFLTISVLWCIIGMVPIKEVVEDVFQKSVESYGATIAVIVFGSWFGKVIVDTGIASSIIKKTVELAGNKALLTTILITLVCTLIFTSAFGVGSVMAIGMIVLPILFSMGLEKRIALAVYMMSVAAGMYLNIAYVSQFDVFFGANYGPSYVRFAIIATLVHVAVILCFIFFHFLFKGKKRFAWAARVPSSQNQVPGYAFIVPFIPILLVALLGWGPIPSFTVGIFVGILLTGNMKSYKRLIDVMQKTLHDGVSDSGLLIGMLYGVNIFQAAANKIAPLLGNLIGNVIPSSPFVLVLAFAILAPLALFRGPLMIFGSGAAVVAILQAVGTFPNTFLFGLFLIPPVAIVANTCPTQSWGMWGLSYSKIEPKTYIKTGIVWSWIICAINLFIAYFMVSGL